MSKEKITEKGLLYQIAVYLKNLVKRKQFVFEFIILDGTEEPKEIHDTNSIEYEFINQGNSICVINDTLFLYPQFSGIPPYRVKLDIRQREMDVQLYTYDFRPLDYQICNEITNPEAVGTYEGTITGTSEGTIIGDITGNIVTSITSGDITGTIIGDFSGTEENNAEPEPNDFTGTVDYAVTLVSDIVTDGIVNLAADLATNTNYDLVQNGTMTMPASEGSSCPKFEVAANDINCEGQLFFRDWFITPAACSFEITLFVDGSAVNGAFVRNGGDSVLDIQDDINNTVLPSFNGTITVSQVGNDLVFTFTDVILPDGSAGVLTGDGIIQAGGCASFVSGPVSMTCEVNMINRLLVITKVPANKRTSNP